MRIIGKRAEKSKKKKIPMVFCSGAGQGEQIPLTNEVYFDKLQTEEGLLK